MKKLFMVFAICLLVFSEVSAAKSKKRAKAETYTEEEKYELPHGDAQYVVLDLEDVKRIEIDAVVPKGDWQLKFDILDDISVYDTFRKDSIDGDYARLEGCDYLGQNYHKILDSTIINKYRAKGVDELLLVFKNRQYIKRSSVNVKVKYTYYKDGEAPVFDNDDEDEE